MDTSASANYAPLAVTELDRSERHRGFVFKLAAGSGVGLGRSR